APVPPTRAEVASCEPSSTTTTSCETPSCARALPSVSFNRDQRPRVGITTDTSGPSSTSDVELRRVCKRSRDQHRDPRAVGARPEVGGSHEEDQAKDHERVEVLLVDQPHNQR